MKKAIIILLVIPLFLNSCRKDSDKPLLNIFSVEDDKQLGLQVEQEISANPAEYPILDRSTYAAAYSYLDRILADILASGKVRYASEFDWRIDIIYDDDVLNAFCAPGGYICVYTGLMKFLDAEDELAGVLGHEIAHADRRHVTNRLTKTYGVAVLLSVVLGDDAATLAEIATGLIALSFSRENETDADEWSVRYLCPTGIDARGAAGFFQKLIDMGASGGVPQFLSTHPNPDNRVGDINDVFNSLCGTPGETYDSRYSDFKATLP